MSLTLITRPRLNTTTYINAIKNATKWTFQRQDQSIATITNNAGFVRIKVITNPETTYDAIIGMSIYIKTNYYDINGLITGFTGSYYIDTDIVFIHNDTLGFINYTRKNYEVQAQVYFGNYAIRLCDIILSSVANSTGLVEINVSTLLRNLCTKEITATYTGVASQDINDNGFFWIRYKEVWKNNTGAWTTDKLPFQYINGVFQPIRTSNNIADLWDICNNATAKFMSDFEEPEYYVGLPFSISYYHNILGFDILTQNLFVVQNKMDINKNIKSFSIGAMPTSPIGFLHHIYMNSSVDCNVDYVELYIQSGDVECENNCYVEPEYVECNYVGCQLTEFDELEIPPPTPPIPEVIPD